MTVYSFHILSRLLTNLSPFLRTDIFSLFLCFSSFFVPSLTRHPSLFPKYKIYVFLSLKVSFISFFPSILLSLSHLSFFLSRLSLCPVFHFQFACLPLFSSHLPFCLHLFGCLDAQLARIRPCFPSLSLYIDLSTSTSFYSSPLISLNPLTLFSPSLSPSSYLSSLPS